ncbi:hypothetical protein CK203_025970 [Vitis vinifera]|uniref:Uncharacterized protein n=1 Tax=Vitis vinifera TaxID=29760 RepID=A0A438IKJ0_VITVI|nr:hypothetical protein CK203_025970 [Vitis vinifera]
MKGQVMADFVLEYSRRPSQHDESSKKEWWTLRVDGASRSSGSGVGLYYSPQLGNIWSKPSGWDSLPLTMKQNMRLSVRIGPRPCSIRLQTPDLVTHNSCNSPKWTIEKIKRADNRRADALAGIAASLPIKEAILLPIHVQPPLCPEISTCNTIEEPQADAKNGCMTSQNISGRNSTRRSQTGTQSPGASCPFTLIGGTCTNDPSQDHTFDYFSKWVEAEAYASIKDKDVTKLKGLNKPKKWVEELPGVLWAYRTTPGRPTGNTPFALAYGMDAVIPTEIGLPTIRTDAAKQSDANMELGRNLDWTDEVRESAAIRMADYQQRASAHYNRKVTKKLQKWYASP